MGGGIKMGNATLSVICRYGGLASVLVFREWESAHVLSVLPAWPGLFWGLLARRLSRAGRESSMCSVGRP
jgi:hypothetical protein